MCLKKGFQLLVYLISFTLNIAVAQPATVVLTGKIINSNAGTPKVLGVNFLNPFSKSRKSASFNEQMEFSTEEEMLFTQNMTVSYNDKFINLYVAPGDTVHLTIDAAKLELPDFKWLDITGDHAAISTQLNLCHHYIAGLPYKKYDYNIAVPGMMDSIKNDYQRYLLALNTYAIQHKLDPVVVDFFKRDIKYGISSWVSDYVNEGNDLLSGKVDRIQLFTDPFFEPFNKSNFVSMMYPYHLANYTYWITENDTSITNSIKENNFDKAIQTGTQLILKESPGIVRDYLLFSFISRLTNKHPELLNNTTYVKQYFSQPIYYEYLVKAASRANKTNFAPAVLSQMLYLLPGGKTTTIPKEEILQLLAKKYPKKVIYVDVYATWCSPCLEEMKYTPQVQKYFAGEDVVFVNLCLQSSEKNWKQLVLKKKIKAENYFLNDDDSKLFMGNYNIGGFPTYLLIDKKGQISTTQAPRPSEKENLKKAITKIIEQKD